MPGFHIHITASSLLGLAYGGAAYTLYGVPPTTSALASVLCSVSGMLPDLDSGPGRPLHESVGFAAAAVPMAMVDRFRFLGWDNEMIILAGAIIYLFIRFVLGEALKKFSVHRGIFHSLPVCLIFAQAAFLICTQGDLALRYFKSGGVVVGFLSHLILDEIWSVDFKHAKLKSSFGTALKLWAPCKWSTLTAYATLCVGTLTTFNDPVWGTGDPREQQFHDVAQRLVRGFEQVESQTQSRGQQAIARQQGSAPVIQPSYPQQPYAQQPATYQPQYQQPTIDPGTYSYPAQPQYQPPPQAYQYPQQPYQPPEYQQPYPQQPYSQGVDPRYQQPGYADPQPMNAAGTGGFAAPPPR